ncbi:tetratricopeptide repeat protein [Desulfatitalea alkaliphila]|uniref:Tetratricopeptide repeat protein n=1 Tax=Desulfatitalea alkaliphila TaxID=2929485 RepID=A0AA41R668_9BACT|nr:tetratricopeptide repeat protein [Desulfatitalea alkaliphila]MCJ8501875.1 tetratricopeptide repeat protein [Desulfatitalea alkaliphila]
MKADLRPTAGLLAGLLLLLSQGCAGAPAWLQIQSRPAMTTSAEAYRAKARALESEGEWRRALFTWRVAAHLVTEQDPATTEAVADLEQRIADTVKTRYQEGVEHFQKGDHALALQSFLAVLHLDPDYKNARYYLKTRLPKAEHATYRVQRGDSFTKIANDIYKDVSKAYVLAYFNDMDPHRPLLIGTLLVLPRLETQQLLPRRDLLTLLDQARRALQQNRYHEAIAITDRINEQSPGNVQAQRMADTAHLAIARSLIAQKKYTAALTRLQQVSADHSRRNRTIAEVRRLMSRETTEQQLHSAQRHLDRGEFAEAIAISRGILDEAPNHRAARGIFEAAHYGLGRRHLELGDEIGAIEALRMLDKNYQDTAQLLNQAQARRNARAETHYREGVMHFLQEELEMAIAAWKKCLTLNPQHPKARQDIDNAKRLLEKWQRLGQEQ